LAAELQALLDSRKRARAAVASGGGQGLRQWVDAHHFVADREPIDFTVWRYLAPLYQAIPAVPPKGMDVVVMKAAQAGASTWALLTTLWLLVTRRLQLAYYLPTKDHAMVFSEERFIRLARENPAIYQLFGATGRPRRAGSLVDEGSRSVRNVGDSVAYFTYMGGKVTTEALPLDAIVFDEVQEMSLSDIEQTEERMSASELALRLRVSTANFEDADIDYYWRRSDQREFVTDCRCPEGVILADCWDPTDGPTCIAEGTASTPGIPAAPHYRCPRCDTRLDDVQAGAFVAQRPGAARIGYHFPQMLSPRQTAASILTKWHERIDTKNFYNRVLGRPYTDPKTLPITQAILENAVDTTLRWGPLDPAATTRPPVFMGIDQMGHDNRVLIACRYYDRMRLLHAETIQEDDPWRRCTELLDEYRVRVCAVEALPNFNEAHRFAKSRDGKVFVVHYVDLVDQIVLWGDRPRDKVTIRKVDEEVRTRWSATVDQYKAMSWALGQWTEGAVVTPDPRTLIQRVRDRGGLKPVEVLREQVWHHLQHVALVTEPIEGREAERKYRRAVRKVGIDPHYAYTWMLLCIAWARVFGTEKMLLVDPTHKPEPTPPAEAISEQIRLRIPHAVERWAAPTMTCGGCAHFDQARGWCGARSFVTQPTLPSCDFFDARLPEGA
jgi:phage terminase large subunit GpA-like protein